jgi:hypothetical protein
VCKKCTNRPKTIRFFGFFGQIRGPEGGFPVFFSLFRGFRGAKNARTGQKQLDFSHFLGRNPVFFHFFGVFGVQKMHEQAKNPYFFTFLGFPGCKNTQVCAIIKEGPCSKPLNSIKMSYPCFH